MTRPVFPTPYDPHFDETPVTVAFITFAGARGTEQHPEWEVPYLAEYMNEQYEAWWVVGREHIGS